MILIDLTFFQQSIKINLSEFAIIARSIKIIFVIAVASLRSTNRNIMCFVDQSKSITPKKKMPDNQSKSITINQDH